MAENTFKPLRTRRTQREKQTFPVHGWAGLGLISVFWSLNWSLPGLRTHYLFFGLWLGFCLTIDGLVYYRKGTSLLSRSAVRYVGLFLVSAPAWWLFEVFNRRLQNWAYLGTEPFSREINWLFATINFSTVIPAVFGVAELMGSFQWLQKLPKGPVIKPTKAVTIGFFCTGWIMLLAMLAWPKRFFPFEWISVYFILEPLNVWLGNRNLASQTAEGDWRPVIALWLGVLLTGFFWEMWNFYSYPKWIYIIPWNAGSRIFEMPLLGYGGYLPFSLELYALYHFVMGLVGERGRRVEYVKLAE